MEEPESGPTRTLTYRLISLFPDETRPLGVSEATAETHVGGLWCVLDHERIAFLRQQIGN